MHGSGMLVAVVGLTACWSVGAAVNVPVALKETKGVEAWVNCAEPGAWRLDVRREGGGQPGVEVVRVTGRAERALKRPKLEVGFRRTDAGNVRTLWRTDLGNRKFSREGVLPWSWSNFETSFGYQMPLYAFLDSNDANVLTLASSDSRNRVGFRGGMEEGPNVMLAKFDFNDGEPEAPTNAFEVCVRCDSRALSADRVVPAAAEWMRKADPSTDYPVPDAAFEPLWSSWCAYHWDETDAIVEREAEEAKKLGLTTVLIDWGWQNPPGKGKFFGEGLPAKRYTDDFAAHVKRLHDKGMAVTMWFPMTLFTDDCPVFESFRPHTLCRRGWGPYVWDPRFAVRRDYFLSCVERAVRDWKVDGLKIDFGDSWGIGYPDSKDKLPKLGDDLGGRDIRDLSDAAALVVGELRRRLTAMRPDLTIEFRQTYIGPGMCKGCTQVRVQDCPGSQREMRYGIANLRLTCGPNAVHSDPIQWNRAEPDEQVADSILASIFGVGQYSVRLTDETPSHKRLLARWVRFAKEHRSALYRGDFRVQGLTYDAPVLVGEDAAERIVGAYVPGFAADCGQPDKRVILLNGTGTGKVLVRFGAEATGTVLDMFGEKVGTCRVPAGLSEVEIPRGGCLEVERPVKAKAWPGFTRGMGIGGWLTNYKRFNVLPMEERLLLSEGDFEHFDGYITEADVRNIKEMGFDHIRLGFDQIVLEEAPGKYRERTFRKVDDFVGWCAKYDLGLVLNLHKAIGNYCDIAEDVSLMDDAKLQERFIALWLEFERRYHDRPKLVFELLNEVRDVDPAKWNDLADRAIRAIRAKNRDRWIVVGPTCWNNPPKLKELKVWDDPRVVYTFHMYWPFEFTHQRGVLQAGPLSYNRVLEYPSADVSRYVGYYKFHGWGDGPFADGRPVDRVRLAENLQPAFDFVKAHPDKILWNGEFGTIRHAPKASRAAYMRDVVSLCKEHGIPWCVWNYLSTPNDGNRFSLVDDDTRKILSAELLDACLGE